MPLGTNVRAMRGGKVHQVRYVSKPGSATGAHTHVQVQKNCGIWWCQSIPFKFTEDSSVSAGTSVKSQNCP